nr:protein UL117 [Mastomys natalensis cytomegalovirus 3]WEG69935.1 protein UL117 [Mastomys natalensis cytomegalovirus 3]WEG70075.1 protein UL117 [Mastomys natalensis cytomegalovirus 3]WEG70215.1 protein UL117 [Mastomys natalensis cytomegalovirus 3]WEG70355.1 protein UL117 [Mastomys natalensis cytomegalovirus 3]
MKSCDVRFPSTTFWSTITYSKVKRPLVTSLSPANVLRSNTIVIRANNTSTEFSKIPPGEAPWETSVRIIGPDAPLETSQICNTNATFVLNNTQIQSAHTNVINEIGNQNYSIPDKRCTTDTYTECPTERIKLTDLQTVDIESLKSIELQTVDTDPHTPIEVQIEQSKPFGIRTTESSNLVKLETINTEPVRYIDPRTEPSKSVELTVGTEPNKSVELTTYTKVTKPIPKIIIGTSEKSGGDTMTLRPRPPKIQNVDTIKEPRLKPTNITHSNDANRNLIKQKFAFKNITSKIMALVNNCNNTFDIQLHFTCKQFDVVKRAYDALSRIPSLTIVMGTQTSTTKCDCRETPKDVGKSNTHIETGQYEISVRSRTCRGLTAAARACINVANTSQRKHCEFRISTNIYNRF